MGDNMHHKHVVLRFKIGNYLSIQRPTEALYLTVNKNEDTVTTNLALELFKRIGT